MKSFLQKHFSKIFWIFLVIQILFLYSPSIAAPLVSDDYDWIAASKDRNPVSFFVTNFKGDLEGGNYGPLVNFSYWINYKIGGLNPTAYHATSLIFHIGVIVLVFLLAKRFAGHQVACISTLLFSVYCNHSEAVSWAAVIPHLGATFFYLLAAYLALLFFDSQKKLLLALSFLAFISSLLFKELAISFPFVITVLYLYTKGFQLDKKSIHNYLKVFFLFIIPLIAYFFVRKYTTGVFFGNYANQSLGIDIVQYLKNVVSFFFAFFTSGHARSAVLFFVDNYIVWSVLGLIILYGCILLTYKKRWKEILVFTAIILLIIAPYFPLKLHPLNNSGERYLYLLSAVIIPILVYLSILLMKKWKHVIAAMLIIMYLVSFHTLYEKNKHWAQAGNIAQHIIEQFGEKVVNHWSGEGEGNVFLFLVDNYEGAEVFRNAIREALSLKYPQYPLDAIVLPVYVTLDKETWNQDIVSWKTLEDESDPGGDDRFLASIQDSHKLFTGFDRRESEDLVFELWDYDYTYFITDKMFLRFKDSLLESAQKKKIYFWYFDQGGLQELKI